MDRQKKAIIKRRAKKLAKALREAEIAAEELDAEITTMRQFVQAMRPALFVARSVRESLGALRSLVGALAETVENVEVEP